jgi:hypothetical protein
MENSEGAAGPSFGVAFSQVDGVGVGGFLAIEEALVYGDSRGLDHRRPVLRTPAHWTQEDPLLARIESESG